MMIWSRTYLSDRIKTATQVLNNIKALQAVPSLQLEAFALEKLRNLFPKRIFATRVVEKLIDRWRRLVNPRLTGSRL